MEYEAMYCENDECRTLVYQTIAKGKRSQNCPGCGQFGRTKGK